MNIREARVARGMSQTVVAEKIGVSTATLSRIETNKQSVDVELLLKLAEILAMDARELLDDPGSGAERGMLAEQIAALASPQRTRLWKDLRNAGKGQPPRADSPNTALAQQVEELAAQVDFLRDSIGSLRDRLRVKRERRVRRR